MIIGSWLTTCAAADSTLWYKTPGSDNLSQGLMLGNGRLGMIVPGGVADENIVLNESSLWTGNSNPSGGYDISISGDFGGYQLFGNLLLNLPNQTTYTGYTRTLDLNLGTATVTYMSGGIAYTRTLFCSAPDQVAVIQLTANTAAAYTGSIQLVDGHATGTISTPGGLMFSGVLPNSELYEAQLQIANRGAHWSTGGALLILPIATA